jgi:hypothetical protein
VEEEDDPTVPGTGVDVVHAHGVDPSGLHRHVVRAEGVVGEPFESLVGSAEHIYAGSFGPAWSGVAHRLGVVERQADPPSEWAFLAVIQFLTAGAKLAGL